MHDITLSAGEKNARDQCNSHHYLKKQCYVCGETCLRTEKTLQLDPLLSFAFLVFLDSSFPTLIPDCGSQFWMRVLSCFEQKRHTNAALHRQTCEMLAITCGMCQSI